MDNAIMTTMTIRSASLGNVLQHLQIKLEKAFYIRGLWEQPQDEGAGNLCVLGLS
jgi:hypothetical protein